MKTFLAVSLLVGLALCNSTAYYGWVPHKEMTYRFESQVLTGIPDIQAQYSGLKLASDVKIQTFDDYSLRIKFENPRYIVVNQKLITREGRPLVPKPEQQLPEPLRRHLNAPFLVHLKRGVVEELFVERDEPVVVTNIKKALLSQLQMDLTATRRDEVPSNKAKKSPSSSISEDITNFFSTLENTVLGDCENTYTINPVPGYQAKEIEERMRTSEKQLMEEGIISGEKSEGEYACRGKKYWEVVKTNNFNNCKEAPIFQTASGIKVKCDFSKAECNDAMTHISTTRYVVCGSSPSEFYIRESITDNDILTNPLGWFASNEKMTSQSRVTLNLLNVKSSGFTPLPKPSSTKSERSLIFQYPKHKLWSSESATKALAPDQERSPYGLDALLPQPDLRSASTLLPSSLPVSELKQKISEQMQKIVEEIFKSPQSCSSRSDIAGSVSAISNYLRPLSYEDLKQVERAIHSNSFTPEEKEIAQELFLDILSMSATNPATMLIKEKIESQTLNERVTVKVLQSTIRNIKTPTQEIMKQLLQLVKSLESRPHVYNIGLVQLSNLVNKACINTDSQTSNFPVRIYGLFCKEDSEFITGEYLPYLVQKLHQSQKESQKLVILSALGKLGHKDILLPMIKVIEDSQSMSPMGRSVAVYMLKRLAKTNPTLVKPIVLTLIDNPAENTEVRIAAVSVLPWTQPTVSDLQKIAVRSWFEPSKQVASFVYSTLKNVVHTEIPELKTVGLKAQGLLKSVKPFQYGIQFSKNTHTKQFVDYLRASSNVEASFVNTENSYIPSRVAFNSFIYGGSWEINGLDFGIYSKGMDSLIDSLWQKLGQPTEISQKVKEQLEHIGQKLNVKKRQPKSPSSLIFFGVLGYDRVYSLDQDFYNEVISRVTEELSRRPEEFAMEHHFNYTHAKYAIELDAVGPTAAGFPLLTSRNVPFVAGIKGSIQAEGRFGERSTVNAKVIPVINAKMQANMGVLAPFTKEFVGAGVETSIHLTLPIHLQSVMNRFGSIELSAQAPEEIQHQFEVLHAFIKPYTVKKSMESLEPISKSPEVKTILSVPEIEKSTERIGETLGLKGIVSVETDYPTPYFSNIWNLIKRHNVFSLLSMGFPSSIKYSSFKFEFNPKESSTKKIETVISTVYGVKNQSSGSKIHYPTQNEIRQDQEMEISQKCEQEHPTSYRKSELCKEQLRERASYNKDIHDRSLRMLEETSGSGLVSGLILESSLHSETSRKTLTTAAVIGGEMEGHKIKAQSQIVFASPTFRKYEVKMNGEVNLPVTGYRWNIEPMIDQSLELTTNWVAKYGPIGGRQEELSMNAKFYKSDSQKSSLKESVEMERCREEMRQGRSLSSICEEVRHQASSVNKLHARFTFPEELKRSWITKKVIYGIASRAFPLIQVENLQSQSNAKQNTIELTTEINRGGDIAQTWLEVPSAKIELRNITVPRPIQGIFPLSLRNAVTTRLIQDMSRDQAPASCRIDNVVSTFDNKTYEYELNECYHLLFKDCSNYQRKSPVAVLAKKINGNKKEVKVISSRSIIELLPNHSGRLGSGAYVKVDGQEIQVSFGSPYIKRSEVSRRVLLKIYRTHDGVVSVSNPVEGLEVFYDGKRVEVVGPQLLRNRACGLCGDLNGENTADLKAPEECIMSTPRLAAYSYILQEGQCPGIPSQYREEYEKEKRQCIKQHTVATPLNKLTKAVLMNKMKQEALTHVFEVQENQICFSKAAIRTCPKASRPEGIRPVEVSFTCMVRTSAKTQQIVKRIKGGDLIAELLEMPTAFTKKQYVPSKCSGPSDLESGDFSTIQKQQQNIY